MLLLFRMCDVAVLMSSSVCQQPIQGNLTKMSELCFPVRWWHPPSGVTLPLRPSPQRWDRLPYTDLGEAFPDLTGDAAQGRWSGGGKRVHARWKGKEINEQQQNKSVTFNHRNVLFSQMKSFFIIVTFLVMGFFLRRTCLAAICCQAGLNHSLSGGFEDCWRFLGRREQRLKLGYKVRAAKNNTSFCIIC